MVENIFVGVLCVIAVSACIWCWMLDNGIMLKKKNNDKENLEEKKSDEKN